MVSFLVGNWSAHSSLGGHGASIGYSLMNSMKLSAHGAY